jgi:hypothetical protein
MTIATIENSAVRLSILFLSGLFIWSLNEKFITATVQKHPTAGQNTVSDKLVTRSATDPKNLPRKSHS